MVYSTANAVELGIPAYSVLAKFSGIIIIRYIHQVLKEKYGIMVVHLVDVVTFSLGVGTCRNTVS